jgi:phosphate starvation-inducible PhoH-like protein
MKMFLTRTGTNSRVVITGDITQVDLPDKKVSGLVQIQGVLQNIPGISIIYLDRNDVVRHKLVRDIIDAYDKFGAQRGGDQKTNGENGTQESTNGRGTAGA